MARRKHHSLAPPNPGALWTPTPALYPLAWPAAEWGRSLTVQVCSRRSGAWATARCYRCCPRLSLPAWQDTRVAGVGGHCHNMIQGEV